jgi:hypothetical protein
MLLSDFFKYLAYGELSQYAVGTFDNGEIAQKDYPKLISFVNRGLTALHTKLPLRLEQVIVQVYGGQAEYTLSSDFAVSNTLDDDTPKYLLDSSNPFKDNLIKIEQVFKEDGTELFLNDSADEDTVYTPQFNVLQFAKPFDGMVAAAYRAEHPSFSMERDVDPSTLTINLPTPLIEPLLTFTVSKLVSARSGGEGLQQGMVLNQSFNRQVQSLIDLGVVQTEAKTSTRIWRDKWV